MKLLISGVGRSGTTLLYQQLAQLLRFHFPSVDYFYEPYLWDIRVGRTKSASFGIEDISHRGVYVHKETPLFLDGPHPIHDPFLDRMFSDAAEDGGERAPATLAKIIRGGGRLRAYLDRFPDLRIVCSPRNPLDVVNSSFALFDLLGSEFFKSDIGRLVEELSARGNAPVEAPDSKMGEGLLWWRGFTAEMVALAKEAPDRVFLFCYDEFVAEPDRLIAAFVAWLKLGTPEEFAIGMSRPAGMRVGQRYLMRSDIVTALPDLDYYRREVLAERLGEHASHKLVDKLIEKYCQRPALFPRSSHPLGARTSIRLRDEILSGRKDKVDQALFTEALEPMRGEARVSEEISQLTRTLFRENVRVPLPLPGVVHKQTFGCIITCHDNAATIAQTIVSTLEQTKKYDKVIVVDDASSDHSGRMIERFTNRYGEIDCIPLKYNVGVAAARHIGISALETDFITQLDGDDFFFPSKNLKEADVVLENPDAIAFSDIALLTESGLQIQDTSGYSQDAIEVFYELLRRRGGVPRDMTFRRELYFEVGGYALYRSHYEDWDFKLRLAKRHPGPWRRADGPAGTIYNRLTPGLSQADDMGHARSLQEVFLANVGDRRYPGHLIAESMLEMMGRFSRDYTNQFAERLAALDTCDLADVAARVTSRDMRSKNSVAFRDLIRSLSIEDLGGELSEEPETTSEGQSAAKPKFRRGVLAEAAAASFSGEGWSEPAPDPHFGAVRTLEGRAPLPNLASAEPKRRRAVQVFCPPETPEGVIRRLRILQGAEPLPTIARRSDAGVWSVGAELRPVTEAEAPEDAFRLSLERKGGGQEPLLVGRVTSTEALDLAMVVPDAGEGDARIDGVSTPVVGRGGLAAAFTFDVDWPAHADLIVEGAGAFPQDGKIKIVLDGVMTISDMRKTDGGWSIRAFAPNPVKPGSRLEVFGPKPKRVFAVARAPEDSSVAESSSDFAKTVRVTNLSRAQSRYASIGLLLGDVTGPGRTFPFVSARFVIQNLSPFLVIDPQDWLDQEPKNAGIEGKIRLYGQRRPLYDAALVQFAPEELQLIETIGLLLPDLIMRAGANAAHAPIFSAMASRFRTALLRSGPVSERLASEAV